MNSKIKDSGVEWIGKIPLEWKIDKISRLTKSYSGGTPSRNITVYWDNGTIPWMSSGEVNNGVIYSTHEKITEVGYQKSSAKMFPKETVVVALNGQGKTKGMSAILMIETTVNQSLVGFICDKKKMNFRYLDYCFKASYYYNRSVLAGGNKRDGIAAESLRQSKVPCPPVEIQIKIASYIDKISIEIDSIIKKTQATIEDYKRLKQSIITEVVTKGLDKNVDMKDSGIEWIGEVPKSWNITKFKNEVYLRARLGWKGLKADEYLDEGIIFLATPNIKDSEIDFVNVNYISRERYEESPEIKVSVGDVLLTKDGSTLGTSNVVRYLPMEVTINGSIALLTPSKKINSIYLHYYIKSTYIQNLIRQKKDGMGVPHLFQRDIKEFPITLPSIEEQIQIGIFLDEKCRVLDNLVTSKEKLLHYLEAYKKSLIYEYVTGKKEVI